MKETDVYREMAVAYRFPNSHYLPLIFKMVITPEQARLLLELPAPTEELTQKFKMDKQEVDKFLDWAFEMGLVFPTKKKGYVFHRATTGIHDAMLSSKYAKDYGDEFFDLWDAFCELEWFPLSAKQFAAGAVPGQRVIPYYRAIQDSPEILPYEDMRQMVQAVEKMVAIPCPCKRAKRDRACGSPEEVCMGFDRAAEYNIRRGSGRELKGDERVALVDLCEDFGLIHWTINQKEPFQIACNCHWCCCDAFEPVMKYGEPGDLYKGVAKSRYEATVDPEKCLGCQLCVERCQFGAAQMKLYPGIKRWKTWVDPELCMGCGSCVIKCPSGARTMKLVRPPEWIPAERVVEAAV